MKNKEYENLKEGQVIILSIDEDISNTLQYDLFRELGFKNLFNTFLHENSDNINKENADIFLSKYTELEEEIAYLKDNIIKNGFGEDYNDIQSNYQYSYRMDLEKNIVIINILYKKEDKNEK